MRFGDKDYVRHLIVAAFDNSGYNIYVSGNRENYKTFRGVFLQYSLYGTNEGLSSAETGLFKFDIKFNKATFDVIVHGCVDELANYESAMPLGDRCHVASHSHANGASTTIRLSSIRLPYTDDAVFAAIRWVSRVHKSYGHVVSAVLPDRRLKDHRQAVKVRMEEERRKRDRLNALNQAVKDLLNDGHDTGLIDSAVNAAQIECAIEK